MSIRVILLSIMVAFLVIYAWKDWYKSLCGLIVLMAFLQHPDMPRQIMGITGLNPLNILMVGVVLAWAVQRRREGLKWDMPRHIGILLLLYLGVITVGVLRAVIDRGHLGREHTAIGMLVGFGLDTLKWVIPGLLLFDGCRTRRRLVLAASCILALYLLLAAQVARHIPARAALGAGVSQTTRLKLGSSVGYSAVDTSALLAGASWGMLACLGICRRRWRRGLLVAVAAFVCYGQALTGGRAGWIAWGATGLILCLIRWRKYLILAPVVAFLLYIIFPGAVQRATFGFGETDVAGEATVDEEKLTSGRTALWPHVIAMIEESPIVGYGRMAMVRTDLLERMIAAGVRVRSLPSHPHNMYLEWLFDNGVIGLVPVMLFCGIVVFDAARLFLVRDDPFCSASGGIALSLVLAQLIAGMGAQHFYPRESTLGMWAAVFLMLRVHVELSRRGAASCGGVGAAVSATAVCLVRRGALGHATY